ncbi:hypothetical protein SPFM6_00104 [Salmonella phage SPFM6]|nr:hypothetical protein SPFM6_00104 [Salmonella phage SPFM6]
MFNRNLNSACFYQTRNVAACGDFAFSFSFFSQRFGNFGNGAQSDGVAEHFVVAATSGNFECYAIGSRVPISFLPAGRLRVYVMPFVEMHRYKARKK